MMIRSMEHKARLNQLRRVESKFFRESHTLNNPEVSLQERMVTHMNTMGLHSYNTTSPRHAEAPLRSLPVNQNQEAFQEECPLQKKKANRPSVGCITYGYNPTRDTSRDEHAAPPSQEVSSHKPSVTRPSSHSPVPYHCSRSTYAFDEGTIFSGGYLEDDFGVPAPPPPAAPGHYVSSYQPCGYAGIYTPPGSDAMHESYYFTYQPQTVTPEQDVRNYSPPPYPDDPPRRAPPQSSHSPNKKREVVPPVVQRSMTPGELQELDIVCGRGAPTNYHYGNQVFKELVATYQTKYLCAKRADKPQLAMKIMDMVKDQGARFVKREKTAGRAIWVEIDPKSSYEKVCQALRQDTAGGRKKALLATVASCEKS